MQKKYELSSAEATRQLGLDIGGRLKGGEVLELSGDVGTGKTTFVKGLSEGLGITEVIQSPTFTISRVYEAPKGVVLYHYDFYRLSEPGIMLGELAESLEDMKNIVAVEWDDTVRDVLPEERTIQLAFTYTGEDTRHVQISADQQMAYLFGENT